VRLRWEGDVVGICSCVRDVVTERRERIFCGIIKCGRCSSVLQRSSGLCRYFYDRKSATGGERKGVG